MSKTEVKNIADILKWCVNQAYCLAKVTFAANGSATAAIVAGQVLEASSTNKIPCTTEASADSVLLEHVTVAEAIAGCSKLAIVRGPAIIDKDALTHTDSTAAATSLAALAVLGIRTIEEPDNYEEGPKIAD